MYCTQHNIYSIICLVTCHVMFLFSGQSASSYCGQHPRETATCVHSEYTSPPTSSITTTLLLSDDPAQWPDVFSHPEKCRIVKRGPVQMVEMEMVMKNREKVQRSSLLYSLSTDSVFSDFLENRTMH